MSELDTPLLARPIGGGIRFDLAVAAIGRRAGAIVPLVALVVAWEAASRSGIVTPFRCPRCSSGSGKMRYPASSRSTSG
jgi:hypothetical protein